MIFLLIFCETGKNSHGHLNLAKKKKCFWYTWKVLKEHCWYNKLFSQQLRVYCSWFVVSHLPHWTRVSQVISGGNMKNEFSHKFSFLIPLVFSVACDFDCVVLHVQLLLLILLILVVGYCWPSLLPGLRVPESKLFMLCNLI